jgi:thymidylate synthase (FAD)
MKLIESSAHYIPQSEGLEGMYKHIELCTRVSYKSEDKITEDSAMNFVNRLIKSKHFAGLEHGTVYLKREIDLSNDDYNFKTFYEQNPYSKITYDGGYCYVTTNYRVAREHHAQVDLYLCEPTEFHEKRYTFKFITDIGVCRELLRHRKFSFINESTRYCNYTKDKFDNGITFIMPSWYLEAKYDSMKLNEFDKYLKQTDEFYKYYIECGMQPQEARQILPLATKTELVMTGFASDWKYLFDTRLFGTTGKPHPDMILLMQKAKEEAERCGIWKDIYKE